MPARVLIVAITLLLVVAQPSLAFEARLDSGGTLQVAEMPGTQLYDETFMRKQTELVVPAMNQGVAMLVPTGRTLKEATAYGMLQVYRKFYPGMTQAILQRQADLVLGQGLQNNKVIQQQAETLREQLNNQLSSSGATEHRYQIRESSMAMVRRVHSAPYLQVLGGYTSGVVEVNGIETPIGRPMLMALLYLPDRELLLTGYWYGLIGESSKTQKYDERFVAWMQSVAAANGERRVR